MKNYKQIADRGQRTAQWFENKEVQVIFRQLERDIYVLWSQTKSDQEDERERLYREMHGLRALKERVKMIIDAGKRAEEELKHGT